MTISVTNYVLVDMHPVPALLVDMHPVDDGDRVMNTACSLYIYS